MNLINIFGYVLGFVAFTISLYIKIKQLLPSIIISLLYTGIMLYSYTISNSTNEKSIHIILYLISYIILNKIINFYTKKGKIVGRAKG